MTRKYYSGDLTDAQWVVIDLWIPQKIGSSKPRTVGMREIFNALLYINRTGFQLQMLPFEFPSRQTVRYYFDKWTYDGTRQSIIDQP